MLCVTYLTDCVVDVVRVEDDGGDETDEHAHHGEGQQDLTHQPPPHGKKYPGYPHLAPLHAATPGRRGHHVAHLGRPSSCRVLPQCLALPASPRHAAAAFSSRHTSHST